MPEPLPASTSVGNGLANPYSVSVAGVLVNDEGSVLLVRRRENGRWEPPGGILERGETIEEGLRREVHEETGLEVEPGPLTGVYQNLRNDVIALAFRCTPTGGELTVNDEASAFRWAAPAELAELTTEVFAVRLLDGVAGGSGPPAVRSHDGVRLL
jgi:8-oxo-dGTP diphosphatase